MSNDETEQTPDSVFFTAIGLELTLGALALLLGWLTNVDVRQWIPRFDAEQPDNLRQWISVASGLGWGVLAAVPMLIAMELLERIDWEPLNSLKSLENLPIVATLLALSRTELVAISISAGVGEELLLRGWLFGWITGPLTSATPVLICTGLVVSSVAFGLLHPITPAYAVIATLIGLYLGALILWTENLLVPITAHAVYDAVHLLLSKHERKQLS